MRIVDCDGFSDSLKYFCVAPLKKLGVAVVATAFKNEPWHQPSGAKKAARNMYANAPHNPISLNVYEPSRKVKGKRTALPFTSVFFGPFLRRRVNGFSKRIFASAGIVQVSALLGRVLACARALDAFHLAGATGNLPLILP
jgi:hypothetical protein